MSRFTKVITPEIHVYHGNDSSIGWFFDITDERYANSGEDEQGEGYVFEYSERFGIGTNHVGFEDSQFLHSLPPTHQEIILACNKFINQLEES